MINFKLLNDVLPEINLKELIVRRQKRDKKYAEIQTANKSIERLTVPYDESDHYQTYYKPGGIGKIKRLDDLHIPCPNLIVDSTKELITDSNNLAPNTYLEPDFDSDGNPNIPDCLLLKIKELSKYSNVQILSIFDSMKEFPILMNKVFSQGISTIPNDTELHALTRLLENKTESSNHVRQNKVPAKHFKLAPKTSLNEEPQPLPPEPTPTLPDEDPSVALLLTSLAAAAIVSLFKSKKPKVEKEPANKTINIQETQTK